MLRVYHCVRNIGNKRKIVNVPNKSIESSRRWVLNVNINTRTLAIHKHTEHTNNRILCKHLNFKLVSGIFLEYSRPYLQAHFYAAAVQRGRQVLVITIHNNIRPTTKSTAIRILGTDWERPVCVSIVNRAMQMYGWQLVRAARSHIDSNRGKVWL